MYTNLKNKNIRRYNCGNFNFGVNFIKSALIMIMKKKFFLNKLWIGSLENNKIMARSMTNESIYYTTYKFEDIVLNSTY